MKKIKLLSILGMIILVLTGCLSESDRAERVLQKHLKERYGEEFVIYGMGKRAGNVRRWYEAAVVYPKSYIGTIKENDSYYWGKGFVELNNGMKGGDTYGKVLLNESANEFYGKKLKELFGENYLTVIDVKGPYSNRDFEKEMESRRISLEKELGGIPPEISGGIYIFGRVENDKDREWYRKQIYEFIQFMKETGTFEYVSLEIFVIDKRVLKETIFYSKDILENLEENRNKLTRKEFFRYRKELLGDYIEDFDIIKNTEKIDKGSYITNGIKGMLYQGIIFYKKLNSPKYIESNNLKNKEKINYDNLNEMQFEWEKF